MRGYDSLGSHRAQEGWGAHRDCPLYQTIQTLSFVQHGFIPVQNPSLSENPVKSVFLGTYTLCVCTFLGEGGVLYLVRVYVYMFVDKANLGSHFSGASHLVFNQVS